MRIIIILLVTIALGLYACKTTKQSTTEVSQLKKNQFLGIPQELSPTATLRGQVVVKDIYFTTNQKNYFVKFSEGYITKEELTKYLGQEILIKGEIKNGPWESHPTVSITQQKSLAAPRSGEYIVLEKIYKTN